MRAETGNSAPTIIKHYLAAKQALTYPSCNQSKMGVFFVPEPIFIL